MDKAQKLEEHKKRLKKIVAKKFKTTMIYPISRFEQDFGNLWGHGLEEKDLTESQMENRKIWKHAREAILDIGNRQLRGFNKELDLHNIEYKGYTTVLKPAIRSFNQ